MPIYDAGPTRSQFDALAAQVAGAVPLPTYTVATLPTPDASNLNRLAGVTDLFGNRTTRMRCEKITVSGTDYFYWQPQSSDSAGSVDVSATNATIGALTMPTTITLVGNVAAAITRNVTLAPGAYPGQIKELRMGWTIGALGSLNILGVASAVALLAGGYSKFASNWSSGTPVWDKLV